MKSIAPVGAAEVDAVPAVDLRVPPLGAHGGRGVDRVVVDEAPQHLAGVDGLVPVEGHQVGPLGGQALQPHRSPRRCVRCVA